MLEGIITGVAIGCIMLIVNAVIRSCGASGRSAKISAAIAELKAGNETILTVLLPLVLAVKGEKPNGELERAIKLLNDYMIHK